MSIEALDWAFKVHLEDPMAKVVLLALANHHNPKSEICWPALDRLMSQTGASRRTVTRAVQRLERLGLITVDRHPRKSNVYLLRVHSWLPSWAIESGASEEELALIGIRVGQRVMCQADASECQSDHPGVSERPPSMVTVATHPCHSGTLIIREPLLNLSENRRELEDFFSDVEMRDLGWEGQSRWKWEELAHAQKVG